MRRSTLVGAAMLALGAAGNAHALVIDDTDLAACDGVDPCAVAPGVSITADPNGLFLDIKTFNGATGLGVDGTPTPGEIDINELLTFSFTSAQIISSIKLLFIYNGPEFGDPKEIASISFGGNTGIFQVFAENSGSWSLVNGATIANCGATTSSGTGCFTIGFPFAQTSGVSLEFTAVHSSGGTGNDSDYSVGGVSTVPEPGMLALLGSGLLGLGLAIRRRHS